MIFEPEIDHKAAGKLNLAESKGLKLDGLPLLEGLRTGAQVIFVSVFALVFVFVFVFVFV